MSTEERVTLQKDDSKPSTTPSAATADDGTDSATPLPSEIADPKKDEFSSSAADFRVTSNSVFGARTDGPGLDIFSITQNMMKKEQERVMCIAVVVFSPTVYLCVESYTSSCLLPKHYCVPLSLPGSPLYPLLPLSSLLIISLTP